MTHDLRVMIIACGMHTCCINSRHVNVTKLLTVKVSHVLLVLYQNSLKLFLKFDLLIHRLMGHGPMGLRYHTIWPIHICWPMWP